MRRKIVIATAIGFLSIAAISVATYRILFPKLPNSVNSAGMVWLNQGWTDGEREGYYRTPQGTLIIPYSWFLALEQPEPLNHTPFSAEDNLLKYDLVPSPISKDNPDRLPIGIIKQTIPDEYYQELGCGAPPCAAGSPLHREWLAYTCATCHTARISYSGKNIGIDGGRGRWNFTAFNKTMANLLLVTAVVPGMFDRFAAKVIKFEGRLDVQDERAKVWKELLDFLQGPKVTAGLMGDIKHTYPTEEGYGRVDALGRGANGEFGSLDERNIVRANAPVLIPPLWYTHDYDWVQSVGAIRQPLGRNVAQSWGVNAAVDILNPNPGKLFDSSIPLEHLFWMETLVSVMTPPAWPEQILGKVDRKAAELGRYLYEEKVFDGALSPAEEQWCPGSPVLPDTDSEPCPNPDRPTKGLCARCHGQAAAVRANAFGKRYWQLPLYKLDVIGTDPLAARNFNARQVYTGNLRALFGGREKVGIGEAFLTATSAIMARGFEDEHIPPDEQPVTSGYRKNGFRAPLAYPARALQGYWAAPPYLHNGSVPNLYELLSPASERSASFWTGDEEFDPVNVGYRSEKFEGGFEFLTKRSYLGAIGYSLRELLAGRLEFKREVDGNSNLGHEFRNAPRGTKGVIGPKLTPEERRAIIEYMKVMPALKPLDGGEELKRRRELLNEMAEQYKGTAEKPPTVLSSAR